MNFRCSRVSEDSRKVEIMNRRNLKNDVETQIKDDELVQKKTFKDSPWGPIT